MKKLFLKDGDLGGFVKKLLATKKVIGPVAQKHKFVFTELETPDDLRLDYDVTILPPKKAILPTTQNLVQFSPDGFKGCIDPTPQILFGVHFYDIKAIDMLDELFAENHADNNYLANRQATTIVGASVQNISNRAFFGTVGKDVKPKGQDAFVTKISGGYLFEAFTEKGEELIPSGSFSEATDAQVKEAKKVNEDVLEKCPEKLTHSSKEIAEKLHASFKNHAVWEKLSELCFSCGTCNIVCPTCYCFDVQDAWNLDQVSGVRYRTWDGCQLHDFALASLGAGATKNFREKTQERYKHRMMRKAAYLNEKLGGPACVGCGRCSVGCVPDIADPVKIIETITEA